MTLQNFCLKESEFGTLAFSSRKEMNDLTTGTGRNRKVTHHCYFLYGQKHAGGLDVFVPVDAVVPTLEHDQTVRLINPVVEGLAQRSDGGGIINWVVKVDTLEAL
ncbi:DUF961 family protein [Listeria booriae]|uniref:DUF961 family protein n=1 Tax=Listeria booriae TaxID=1552123 RepID=UPI00164D8909|nr:DUF961 family protein [Listeria booriae]MBC6133499.1 DUF961 family protein [Listeria booriae]MBC6163017.1 DUF961 family protein [Listeria booriae]